MAEFTKGPWECLPDDNGKESTEIRCRGALIANVYGSEDFPCLTDEDRDTYPAECLANARLIAAAPDLYSALQDLIRLTEHICKMTGWSAKLAMHKAAIASAEGAPDA